MAHKVLTVAQQKGGAGKTTLAAQLAVALSQQGRRVAALDIDPQGSLSAWHAIREERFGEGYTGITFRQLTGWRIGSEINRLKDDHDVTIIDSPPHTETEAKNAIRHADLLLLPVQPSPTDLWATQATIELAGEAKIPYRVVLNRVSPKAKLAETIADALTQRTEAILGNRVAFASSLMEGRGVTETAPRSLAADEIKALAGELMRAMGFRPRRQQIEEKEAA